MLKVGLIGVGGISGAHIPAWDAMKDAELVALCDIRPEQMEKYPDKRHYSALEEMLEKESLDILDICLPTFLHVEYSIKALEKGVNVICEKPVSLNKGDAKKIYSVAEKNNVKFMIAHVLRFWPEYELIKELYENEKYGKLLSGSMSRLSNIPKWSWDGWMTDETRSGLVPYDLHIHDLDFLIYAFGKPNKISGSREKRPEQDVLCALYDYGDFYVTAEAAWYNSPYPFTMKFRFQFEKAIVAWEKGVMKIYESEGRIFEVGSDSNTDTGNIDLPKSDAYANEIRYFANCVINGRAPERVKADELETVIEILNDTF